MKKLILIFCLQFPIGFLFASMEVKEVAKDWALTAISVSTKTVTTLPALNFSGRYKIQCENTDFQYDVSLGTFSTFTYGNGWILKSTSTVSGLSQIVLPLNSGTTIYALGQAQTSQANVSVRCIEFK